MGNDEHPAPVTVFESNDPARLAVAKSLLEGAGIEFNVAGEVLMNLILGSAGGNYNMPRIEVAAEDAEDACELLKDLGS